MNDEVLHIDEDDVDPEIDAYLIRKIREVTRRDPEALNGHGWVCTVHSFPSARWAPSFRLSMLCDMCCAAFYCCLLASTLSTRALVLHRVDGHHSTMPLVMGALKRSRHL